MPAVLDAADEVVVGLSLEHKFDALDIDSTVDEVMKRHSNTRGEDLKEVLAADAWARETTVTLAEDKYVA